MQMFALSARCYENAGDIVRAKACRAIDALYSLFQKAGEDGEEASGVAAVRGTRGGRGPGGGGAGRERRRQVLLSAADDLLTCAVDEKAGSREEVAGAAAAAAPTEGEGAAARNPGDDKVVSLGYGNQPVTSADLTLWLHLSAKAFAAAGANLEAGRLYLSLGKVEKATAQLKKAAARNPGAGGASSGTSGVAEVYEAAAARELQRLRGSARPDVFGGAAVEGPAAAGGGGAQGAGYLAAARLLKEAWGVRYEEGEAGRARCWEMLLEHGDGLRALLPAARVEVVAMVSPMCASEIIVTNINTTQHNTTQQNTTCTGRAQVCALSEVVLDPLLAGQGESICYGLARVSLRPPLG